MGELKSSEDRRAARHKTLLTGRIIFSGGSTTVDCVVRDRSEFGARIRLSSAVTIPDRFLLEIPDRRERVFARLVWANGVEAGIAIDPQYAGADGEDSLRRRIRELEQSVLMLQNRIRELDGSTAIAFDPLRGHHRPRSSERPFSVAPGVESPETSDHR